MRIDVAYTTATRQFFRSVDLGEGATIAQAVEKSGILQQFPEIDLDTQKVGIFGKLKKLDAVLADGDRVEVYRAITADPETVPRRDIPED